MPAHFIQGHAIISPEGAIADASGTIPESLKIEADWLYFQRQLDLSALTVLGRLSHEAAPNPGRRRLILTGTVSGLVRKDALVWEINPAEFDVSRALNQLVPDGGRIAVVGGRAVFDLFFAVGYDAFHLTVVGTSQVIGGIPAFSGVSAAREAIERLTDHGLGLGEKRTLDPAAGAVLWYFRRPRSDGSNT